jgi:hypothetical protein
MMYLASVSRDFPGAFIGRLPDLIQPLDEGLPMEPGPDRETIRKMSPLSRKSRGRVNILSAAMDFAMATSNEEVAETTNNVDTTDDSSSEAKVDDDSLYDSSSPPSPHRDSLHTEDITASNSPPSVPGRSRRTIPDAEQAASSAGEPGILSRSDVYCKLATHPTTTLIY